MITTPNSVVFFKFYF